MIYFFYTWFLAQLDQKFLDGIYLRCPDIGKVYGTYTTMRKKGECVLNEP